MKYKLSKNKESNYFHQVEGSECQLGFIKNLSYLLDTMLQIFKPLVLFKSFD